MRKTLQGFRKESRFVLVCNEDSREDFVKKLDAKSNQKEEDCIKSTYQDLKGFYFSKVQTMTAKELEIELEKL